MIVTAKDNKVVLEPVFQITRSVVVMQITEGVPKIKQKNSLPDVEQRTGILLGCGKGE